MAVGGRQHGVGCWGGGGCWCQLVRERGLSFRVAEEQIEQKSKQEGKNLKTKAKKRD